MLATIICSLHENGIDVPRSEPDIYRKKIDLLCESYDRHKNIMRTKTPPEILKRTCRKVAFFLHENGLREMPFKELVTDSLLASSHTNKDVFIQALEELVDPCNVLKRDPITMLYGFGHLRYQEFLAAEEISVNRGIDIPPLLTSDWWRGVMYLFACDNQVDALILESYKMFGSLRSCEGTLRYIFGARPKSEQQMLTQLLDQYIVLEDHDAYDNSIYDDSSDYLDLRDRYYIPEF